MAGERIADVYLVYQFLKRLTTPFNQTKAFELGLIDAQGNRLKKAETSAEKAAMGYFDRLVFNLKRLLAKVPGGSSKLASYAAALVLVKESVDPKAHYSDEELVEQLNENYTLLDEQSLKSFDRLMEDAAANATGPAVAGTGDDPVHWKKMDGRNKQTKMFLRRYMQGQETRKKQYARKKRKDFFKQIGIDV